jgi:hypothetical protein
MHRMDGMSRFRRPRGLTLWLLLLPLVWEAGCSRPVGLTAPEDAPPPDQHQVPFHEGNSVANGTPAAMGQDRGLKPGTDLPFRDPQNLPAGTLLTVRLKSSVSADNPKGRDTFEAVVDEPVTIEGNTLVPRGASVVGRIESASGASARISETKRNGYVRLTLESIDITGAGKDQPLQTSSLFARGRPAARNGMPGLITLEKGRRLTFRLTEPAYVASQQSATDY